MNTPMVHMNLHLSNLLVLPPPNLFSFSHSHSTFVLSQLFVLALCW
jgi:hypothetical protein